MNFQIRKVMLYFSTIILAQLVSFLLLPVITKNINPDVYGQYALTLAIFSFVGVLGSNWIRNVSFRLYYDKRKEGTRAFYFNTIVFQFTTILVISSILIVVLKLSFLGSYSTLLLITAGISIITGDFFAVTVDILRAENLSGSFAISQAVNALSRFISVSVGLWMGFKSPVFLFSCTMLSSLLAGGFGIHFLKGKLYGKIQFSKQYFQEISGLGLVSIPSSIGVWILALSDRVVLKIFTTSAVVGIYSVGYSLGEKVVGGISAAIFMMSWPTILESWKKGGELEASKAINSALKLYLWMTIGPLFLIIGYHYQITKLITSEEYISAASILPIVAVGCWIDGVRKYLSRPIELVKKYKLMSIITGISALVNILLNFILVPSMGAIGAAVSTLVAFSVSFIFTVAWTNRDMIIFPWIDFLITILFSIVIFGVSNIYGSDLEKIIIYCTLYAAGFGVFFNLKRKPQLVSLFKRKIYER